MPKAQSTEQVRVATTTCKAVEVIACPGSGKTQTLLARIDHLISKGLPPSSILVLTFTKAASTVMKRRLAAVGGRAGVVVMDFHAFSNYVISKNLRLLDFAKQPAILSPKQAGNLLSRASSIIYDQLSEQFEELTYGSPQRVAMSFEMKWLWSAMLKPAKLLKAISFGMATGMSLQRVSDAHQFAWLNRYAATVKRVRVQYARLKRENGALDFDDLLLFAHKAVTSTSTGGAPAKVRSLDFRHLLVDEYQDTSRAQARLIAALSRRIRRVMVVGDPHQAIFGFGGACYKPLSTVIADVTTMTLTESFRMSQPIADLATAVLNAYFDGSGVAVPSIKGKKGGVKPVLVTCLSDLDQATEVAARVRRLLIAGAKPSDIVILSRINSHLTPVARGLGALKINNERHGRDFDLAHVLTVLRLVTLMENSVSPVVEQISAVLEIPDLSASVMDNVLRACKTGSKSQMLEGRYKSSASALLIALGGVRQNSEIRAGLAEWQPLCRSYENARAMAHAIKETGAAGAIEGLNIHKAKGGEWPHVFVIGATEGVIPDHHAWTIEQKLEERNALYVAITRASSTLTILHAPQTIMTQHKKYEHVDRLSQFLNHKSVLKYLTKEQSTEILARSKNC